MNCKAVPSQRQPVDLSSRRNYVSKFSHDIRHKRHNQSGLRPFRAFATNLNTSYRSDLLARLSISHETSEWTECSIEPLGLLILIRYLWNAPYQTCVEKICHFLISSEFAPPAPLLSQLPRHCFTNTFFFKRIFFEAFLRLNSTLTAFW